MGELHAAADEPEHGDRPDSHVAGARDEESALRARVEQRSRSEYASDLEQQVVSGWGPRLFASPVEALAPSPDGQTTNHTADRESQPDPLLEAVRRLEPSRAGLPDISARDGAAYLNAHEKERPWLTAVHGCSPEVQRVFAALDQGGCHGHVRHEGWVTEEMNQRRVAFLEDPAQLDPAKRAAGIDGLKPGEQPHQCRQMAGRIIDPNAFAVAFARGIEHPRVRAALETAFHPDAKPSPVQVPIEELLGPAGHQYCTGWKLEPVDGSMNAARRGREAWIAASASYRASDLREPTARPVETFEGGTVVFAFGHSSTAEGYEVVTIYPRPPEHGR
jgi:hypothetical protein